MLAATCAFFAYEAIAADGPIVAVQEALKKQQLLSAEPTGVLDFQTRAALRKFQTQRGLQPTGEIDTPTLEALQKQAAAAPADKPGREPIKAIVKEDGEFLKKVEKASGTEAISQPTGATTQQAAAAPPTVAPPTTTPSADVPQFPVVPPPPAPGVAAPDVTPPPVPAPPAPDRPPSGEPSTSPERTPTSTVSEPEKKSEKVSSKTEGTKNRVTEKPRAGRKAEQTPLAQTEATSSPEARESQPAAADAARGTELGVTSSAESERDSRQPVGRSGKRARTSRAPAIGGGHQSKPSTYPATPVPVRRAEAVQPPRRDGFFDRLFKDD